MTLMRSFSPLGAVRLVGSHRLALAIIGVVVALALAGILLPQEGRMRRSEIAAWQAARPALTALCNPLGLFNVFHSKVFLSALAVLGMNVAACTVVRMADVGWRQIRAGGSTAVRTTGFLAIHASILLLLGGGFCSSGWRQSGMLLLTEGQEFGDRHDEYLRISEGPLRREVHDRFRLQLERVDVTFREKRFETDVAATVNIADRHAPPQAGRTVRVNHPLSYGKRSLTIDETGFSPRLIVTDARSDSVLVDTYLSLTTFRTGGEREYHDFLPLDFLPRRVFLTVMPDFEMRNGVPVKVGDDPDRPLLVVQESDGGDRVFSRQFATPGSEVTLGQYRVRFAGLRRWASFLVVEDPGYAIVYIAMWLGVAALLLRYLPELRGNRPASEVH